jgi:cobaltochelatase CobN
MTTMFNLCPHAVPPNPACPAPRPWGRAGLGAILTLLMLAALVLAARGVDVLPVFSHGVRDKAAGALGPIETAERFFMDEDGSPRVQALINLHFFFLGREARGDVAATGVAAQSVEIFSALNVPVVKPVTAYSQDIAEWEQNPQGLFTEVTFGIAIPEFEGNIEPIVMACSRKWT